MSTIPNKKRISTTWNPSFEIGAPAAAETAVADEILESKSESEQEPHQEQEPKKEIGKYVYQKLKGGFTVGFYTPGGKWVADTAYPSSKKAAERVAFLNGLPMEQDN